MNWTIEEKNTLKNVYPQFLAGKLDRKQLVKKFNRTLMSIFSHASNYGLAHNGIYNDDIYINRLWNPEDIDLLNQLYPKYLLGNISRKKMVRMLNRSYAAIRKKACKIGITNQYRNKGDTINYEYYKTIKRRILYEKG